MDDPRRLEPARACERCGKALTKPSQKRFCSRNCGMLSGPRPMGRDNHRYNGGFSVSRGRGIIVCRDGSLMAYARALMAAHIGRLLESGEIVHHINGDSTDDRIENLQVTNRAEHMLMHRDDLLAGRGLA